MEELRLSDRGFLCPGSCGGCGEESVARGVHCAYGCAEFGYLSFGTEETLLVRGREVSDLSRPGLNYVCLGFVVVGQSVGEF